MKRTYVLDTSVIITNPKIYDFFKNSEFVIPIIVLEELDKIKHQSGDAARHARIAIKYLDELTSSTEDISKGIALDNGSILFIDGRAYKTPIGEEKTNDLRIIACAKAHAKKGKNVTVLSNDVNMRVRAKSIEIASEGHQALKTDLNELYTGVQYFCNDEILAALYENEDVIDPEKYGMDLVENEYAIFDNSENQNAIGKKMEDGLLHLINTNKPQSNWIEAQNVEQFCALDALLDPKIPLVTLVGLAGSGKSLIAICAAMELVFTRHLYDRIVIYKSIVPVGADIGYSPGTVDEKLSHWFGAIYDCFEFVFSSKSKEQLRDHFGKNGKREIKDLDKPAHFKWKDQLDQYKKEGKICFEAMTYIRGRSIDNAIIIYDEFQNVSKEEAKTVLTRAGKNSKIIALGDLEQIDNPRLDALSNGLTYIVEKFKGNPIASHVTLKECERSILAEVASKIL